MERAAERISLLQEFVRDQLIEGTDYGNIPGTPKPSLWQPGAQKLIRLFGLTCQKECTHREVDWDQNYASFSYKATVYRGNQIISQCEGSCNSGELKYQRTKTQLPDKLNTLQKMAQKRAFVGAVIEAVAGSMTFTQDIESPEDVQALGIKTRQTASVKIPQHKAPKVVSAVSTDQTQNVCDCGNSMMISKYNTAELYCNPKAGGCGLKRARG
jgi:hypothetical protein